jgi:hypothetical protein
MKYLNFVKKKTNANVRSDCPVCKGKGWYMSGDNILKIECTYCEVDKGLLSIKFDDFKKQLSEFVNEDYIESWLQKPNIAFDNRKPIDLINEDNYQRLYSMIYRLRTGEPLS